AGAEPLLGDRGNGGRGVHTAARRHRIHLGAPGSPVSEAGQERVDRVRHGRPAPRGAVPPGRPIRGLILADPGNAATATAPCTPADHVPALATADVSALAVPPGPGATAAAGRSRG